MTRPDLIEFLQSYYWVSSGGTRTVSKMFPGQIEAVMTAVDAYVADIGKEV